MDSAILSQKIRTMAETNGIDMIGFADASEFSGYALKSSIRRDPKLSMPDAESIIVAGIYIGGLKLPVWDDVRYGRTSRLFLSGYFDDVVEPLQPIVDFLKNQGYQAMVCDDAADRGSILPLKLAAIRAGFGWQGRHSLLISKKFGTFIALGGILTNAVLEHNTIQEPNRCTKCDLCQKACPMAALETPHVLDRSRCLSSILLSNDIPEDARAVLGNRVEDCEICQEACPWNQKHIKKPLATKLTESFQQEIDDWERFFYLPDLVRVSEEGYKEKFRRLKTGIPFHIFHRNVLRANDHLAVVNQTAISESSDEKTPKTSGYTND